MEKEAGHVLVSRSKVRSGEGGVYRGRPRRLYIKLVSLCRGEKEMKATELQ